MEYGKRFGILSPDAYQRMRSKKEAMKRLTHVLDTVSVAPDEVNHILDAAGSERIAVRERVTRILKRPNVRLKEMLGVPSVGSQAAVSNVLGPLRDGLLDDVIHQTETELKYEGYIQRQHEQVERFDRYESMRIPEDIDYNSFRSLSAEGIEKLSRVRPESIGQASRISGVTPSDVSVLLVYLRG